MGHGLDPSHVTNTNHSPAPSVGEHSSGKLDLVLAYLDDVVISGNVDEVYCALQILLQEAPLLGLKLNLEV